MKRTRARVIKVVVHKFLRFVENTQTDLAVVKSHPLKGGGAQGPDGRWGEGRGGGLSIAATGWLVVEVSIPRLSGRR